MKTSHNGHEGHDERLISRLKKIEALARSGIEGERTSAQRLLAELCEKHGVTIEALASDKAKFCFFPARDQFEKTLLIQVVIFALRTKQIRNLKDSKRHGWWFVLTEAQRIDVEECFANYKRAWKEQLGDILLAFIAKNGIFGPREDNDETPSAEAVEQARRISELMSGMAAAKRWNKPAGLLTQSAI